MITALSETTPQGLEFNTLEAYQAWAATDWLYDLGSDDAQMHIRAKYEEEMSELADALSKDNEEEIISELGDVLWTASGAAFNSGISLEESIRNELSTDFYDDTPITTAQIDSMALELIPDRPTDVMIGWLRYLSHYYSKASKQWFRLGPLVDIEQEPQSFSDALIRTKRARTHDGLTQILLICSALAQRRTGKSIEDVMIYNANKLERRKSNGLPITRDPKLTQNQDVQTQ